MGVIAQDVRKVLPEAVTSGGRFEMADGRRLDEMLIVNKDRLFLGESLTLSLFNIALYINWAPKKLSSLPGPQRARDGVRVVVDVQVLDSVLGEPVVPADPVADQGRDVRAGQGQEESRLKAGRRVTCPMPWTHGVRIRLG